LEYKDKYSYGNQDRQTTNSAKIVALYLEKGMTKNIKTRYFTITVYKKGTMHFVFDDLEMLRKFNIYVAKQKGWLPSNYGYTAKQEFKDFETTKEYKQIGTELAIDTKKVLMLN
jgi:hypothetical protein